MFLYCYGIPQESISLGCSLFMSSIIPNYSSRSALSISDKPFNASESPSRYYVSLDIRPTSWSGPWADISLNIFLNFYSDISFPIKLIFQVLLFDFDHDTDQDFVWGSVISFYDFGWDFVNHFFDLFFFFEMFIDQPRLGQIIGIHGSAFKSVTLPVIKSPLPPFWSLCYSVFGS